jgi:outer membrane receptor protein involved in Fe transport
MTPSTHLYHAALLRLAFVFAAIATSLAAQTAASPATTAASKDEAVVLSPFEVNSADDKGYAASSALAGTRTNEKLANLPNSISVFTADLLSDLALNDFFGAVEFAAGA